MSKSKAFNLAITMGLVAFATLTPTGAVSPASAETGLCAAKSDYADEEWITTLQLGTSNPITGVQGETYTDATDTTLGTFAAGSTGNQISVAVNVDMTNNPADIWDENVYIWLDLNQDGQVDLDTEQIFAETQTTDNFDVPDPTNYPDSKTYTYTGTFNMPQSAYNGTAIGRAMLQFVEPGATPVMCNTDSGAYTPGVTAFEAGTVLDFKIDVTGGVDNPATTNNSTLANTGTETEKVAMFGGAIAIVGAAIVAATRRPKKAL